MFGPSFEHFLGLSRIQLMYVVNIRFFGFGFNEFNTNVELVKRILKLDK